MRASLHLQNVHSAACAQNVSFALWLVEGVQAVEVDRESGVADVLYEEPASTEQLEAQLASAGYLRHQLKEVNS